MLSEVKIINGLPTLTVNGKPLPEMAYITYLPENNRYGDFASAGVKLYSVCLNFSEQPINENAPVLVFQKGIFEKEEPDFSIVQKNFDDILSACPDAYIFPRVNVNLPRSWEKSHPNELCEYSKNGRKRASFASDLWADEVKKYLTQLVDYIENSPYAERVIGYQIAGGNTDEWFPFDDCGFYGKRAKDKFLRFCEQNKLEKNEENYFRFVSQTIVDRIIEFAQTVKAAVEYRKLVGAFYGYTIGCPNRALGHLALGRLLESDRVDFICSPLIYSHGRQVGLDTYPMIPVGSVKLHNMLYFSENDIRTHLSRPISPHPNYSRKIWTGPKKSISLEQIKVNFCRALIYGYGMWWFDMWGGWYKDSDFMSAFRRMSEICAGGMDNPVCEVAVFLDENSYLLRNHRVVEWNTCNMLGLTGAMNDVFLASDFDAVYENYKACIFIQPIETALMSDCIRKAETSGKAVKIVSEDDAELTADDFKEFLSRADVQTFTPQKAVVYTGHRFVSFYAHENGVYDFTLDGKKTFTDLFTGEEISFPREIKNTVCWLFER